MPNQWFYKDGNEVVGPVDDRALRNAAKAGDLTAASAVRLGEQGWHSAKPNMGPKTCPHCGKIIP
jgi:hypothetical protein